MNETKKQYYKKLLNDYNTFISNNNLPSTISKSLFSNIKNFKKLLFSFYCINPDNIYIFDCENIIKNYKIISLLSSHIPDINITFHNWLFGYFSDNKYILPFSSTNLSSFDKILLLNTLFFNYFKNFYIIAVFSNKDPAANLSYFSNNILFLNISYHSNDCLREQDDHLILFLSFHFSNSFIVSNDKFLWFPSVFNRLYYSFTYSSTLSPSIILNKTLLNDSISSFPFFYYNHPFINSNTSNTDLLLCYSMLLNNSFDIFTITSLLNKYILLVSSNFSFLSCLFNSLSSYSLSSLSSLSSISSITLLNNNGEKGENEGEEEIINEIENYGKYCEMYLVMKNIILNINRDETYILISRLFSKIIKLYDEIEENQNKIRKIIRIDGRNMNKYILMYSQYIYMKKNGFCRKDY